ncbi:MAG: hypothetical protein AAF358_22515 [Pseudomonadota bacterium]
MTNFEAGPKSIGDAPERLESNPKLARAYQALTQETEIRGPAMSVDDAIRERAHRPAPGGRWIWPASLAASLALCTTLVFQLAKVVQPNLPSGPTRTSPLVTAPELSAPQDRSAPAVGAGAVDTGVTSVADATEAAPALDSPEFWWEQLRLHARNADREGFLATWEVYQQHRDDTPLPADLRQWIADNQLPLTDLTDG